MEKSTQTLTMNRISWGRNFSRFVLGGNGRLALEGQWAGNEVSRGFFQTENCAGNQLGAPGEV
jgi:hypothetical protein